MNRKVKCPVCGKEVILYDVKNSSPYCSQKCAKNARYIDRYGDLPIEQKLEILKKINN